MNTKVSTVPTSPVTAASAPATSAATRSPIARAALGVLDYILPVGTLALIVVFAMASPAFLTADNFMVIATQNAALMVTATAMAVLMMSGGVDLSVGSVMAVSGVTAALAFQSFGPVVGVVLALLVGLTAGAINGLLIGVLGLSPLVVTLGMLAILRATAISLAPTSIYGFPEAIQELGSGRLFGVSYLVWIAIGVVLLAMFLMNRFPVGRHIVAVGVNSRAAYLNGVRVKAVSFGLYAMVGLAAGLSGLVTVARLDSAPSATLGLGFEISVLTAVLLGSIPFNGGKGSLWRVVVGVALMGILRNGVTLLNATSETADLLTGMILIVAAGLEAIRYFARKRF